MNRFLNYLCALGLITGCKTTSDMVRSRPYVDPTGVKTVDSDALATKGNSQSGDTGSELDNLRRENATLKGEVEELKFALDSAQKNSGTRLAELEDQNRKLAEELLKIRDKVAPTGGGELSGAGAPSASASADKLWQLAMGDVSNGQYGNARKAFADFFRSYPKDNRAVLALLGQGFAQYALKEFDQAALSFNQVIDKFPKRRQAGMAWFGQAASFAQLGQRQDARLFFDEVRKRYPRTSEAILAARQIERKDKTPEDLFKVFPKWAARP